MSSVSGISNSYTPTGDPTADYQKWLTNFENATVSACEQDLNDQTKEQKQVDDTFKQESQ
ncbi:MAG TPA: hypothetical protein VGJ00_00090 [Rhabdochlamydiaceae bacterium]|jgi:hypothetical protein